MRLGDKLAGHGRGHVEHLHPFRLQPNLRQQLLDSLYPPAGAGITFQVMAIAGQSTGHHQAVGPALEGVQRHQYIELARTWQLYDSDFRRILHPQTAGQVGGGVGAMLAAEGHYA